MKKEYLLEVTRIKEIMGLIVEGNPLISKFDFNNIVRREIADDIDAKAYNFQNGRLQSLTDIEDELSYIFRKEFDNITKEELTFLKDFNSKILKLEDIESIAAGLKNDFLTIKGDDLAKAKFFNEMEEIFSPTQFEVFKSKVSPNRFDVYSKETLAQYWEQQKTRLLKETPTVDDIKLLDTLYSRGVITKEDYTKALSSTPGFRDAWKLYSSYVEFSKKTPDVTFEKYLEMKLSKNPNFAGQAGIIAKKLSQPITNFVNGGLNADIKLMGKGAIGMLVQTTFFASLGGIWNILKLTSLAVGTSGELVQKGVKFLTDYKGVSDEVIKDRWTKYWSYDNPQILVNGRTMSIYEGGKNSDFTKGNAPQYIRLGKTNNLKLTKPLDIDGSSTIVVEFKLSTTPIVAGMESFSPDVITLPSSTTTTTTGTTTQTQYEMSISDFLIWADKSKVKLSDNEKKSITIEEDPLYGEKVIKITTDFGPKKTYGLKSDKSGFSG